MTAKLDQLLQRLINVQLKGQGLKVAGSRGAIIDATIIECVVRPNQHIEVDDEGQADVVDNADEDAHRVKKGKDAFFGYRGYSVVDTEDGFVEHVEVYPANQAEVNKLPGIVDELIEQGIQPEGMLADKGYASATKREYLKNKGIGDLIRFKGSRGNPVHPLQTRMNRAIATLRYKVEQGFGTMKRRFHLNRARYFGLAKTQAQMVWAALGVTRTLQSRPLQPYAGSRPSRRAKGPRVRGESRSRRTEIGQFLSHSETNNNCGGECRCGKGYAEISVQGCLVRTYCGIPNFN